MLKKIQGDSGGRELLFPHPTKHDKPASENAVLFMLASIGYKGRMTGHGFRSLLSTAANRSKKWDRDLIESALAHAEENDVRTAYLRTDFHEERAPMMQWWADELDRLETVEST